MTIVSYIKLIKNTVYSFKLMRKTLLASSHYPVEKKLFTENLT